MIALTVALLLLAVALGVWGITQMRSLAGTLDELVNHRMENSQRIAQLKNNSQNLAPQLRDYILTENPQRREEIKKSFAFVRTGNAELVDYLQKSIKNPKRKELLQEMLRLRTPYIQVITQIQDSMKQGDKAKATQLVTEELPPLQDTYFAALDKLQQAQANAMVELANDSLDAATEASVQTALVLLLMLAFGAVATVWIVRSIMRPLNQAVHAVRTIAAGDLSQNVPKGQHDELGVLLAAMADMRERLVEMIAQVLNSSDSVATASAQIAMGNKDLADRTTSQAGALQQTAASMEELGSTVSINADNARLANDLAHAASSVASKGGAVVAQAVSTMKGIHESSQRIADIISVIDGIAFQTNILALNAAVEAARAGEQGRGFAVVASEVRALAGRTASAAKEIKSLITSSVECVEAGSSQVGEAGHLMQEVVDSIVRVTQLMGHISTASAEQASGVGQVGQALSTLEDSTQRNAALVEEMAAAADSLNQQAQSLVRTSSVFKLAHTPSYSLALV
ncbi:MCP four helix bundle domain-containing protein [Curvibacter sp. CHRR-16]|nr:MCP four helix bundle domain-containing protein [Curvibacter sp. CHRR-16]